MLKLRFLIWLVVGGVNLVLQGAELGDASGAASLGKRVPKRKQWYEPDEGLLAVERARLLGNRHACKYSVHADVALPAANLVGIDLAGLLTSESQLRQIVKGYQRNGLEVKRRGAIICPMVTCQGVAGYSNITAHLVAKHCQPDLRSQLYPKYVRNYERRRPATLVPAPVPAPALITGTLMKGLIPVLASLADGEAGDISDSLSCDSCLSWDAAGAYKSPAVPSPARKRARR